MANRVNIQKSLIDEAVSTIEGLRARLAQYEGESVGSAIQKAVERPATPDGGRNATVTAIVRPAMFAKKTTPLTKAQRLANEKTKRQQNREALRVAQGLRPKSRYDREV
jgi:hypothetical protein